MIIDDVIRLIMSSSEKEPVSIKYVDGKVHRAVIKTDDKVLMEAELRRMLEQIGERYKHGTLDAYRQDGKIIVTWEESVILGERR